MLSHLVLFLSSFLLFTSLVHFRTIFHSLAQNSVSLVNALIAKVDELEKIRIIQQSTNRLLNTLVKMLLVLILSMIVGSIPLLLFCLVRGAELSSLALSSFYSILAISLGATAPLLLPRKKKAGSEYSELSRLLHRISLDNYNIAYRLFRWEVKKLRKKGLDHSAGFVIVSGLARAGTTSLLNDLSRFSDFVTLSYANMPFLLCPNTWKKIYRPKTGDLKERSHRDGIMIGLDSNEALEEFFFKVITNDSYIEGSRLSRHEISRENYLDYMDYQSILRPGKKRIYLAKNNNYILRYNSMRDHNQDFIMVIMYRDPLAQAASLMEKHIEYSELQQKEPFVLEYMNWLGHHEFGLAQKTFSFNGEDIAGDKRTLDYWLRIWINYYGHVLSLDHSNTFLVAYDDYCRDPQHVVSRIARKAGIGGTVPELSPFNNERSFEQAYSDSLYRKALEIYKELARSGQSSSPA